MPRLALIWIISLVALLTIACLASPGARGLPPALSTTPESTAKTAFTPTAPEAAQAARSGPHASPTSSHSPAQATFTMAATAPALAFKDIPYAQSSSRRPCSTCLDVYPLPGSNHPLMIYVHGGGWSAGDKKNVEEKPAAFNQAGYVFISVNYRLLPEADIPTQAQDVAQAVAWAHANAAAYGGDPQRLYLMGHSAGAHLVSLVGTDPVYLENAGLSLDALSGVVALDTQAYDVPRLMSDRNQPGWGIYRRAFGDDPAFWERVSPIFHVNSGRAIPPFIVAYSRQGGPERAAQAEQFVARLKEAGFVAELLPAAEKTHAQINRQFGEPGDPVTQAVLEFLSRTLLPE